MSEYTSVSDYASIINNVPMNTYQGTFIAFKQSSVKPDTPQGGS